MSTTSTIEDFKTFLIDSVSKSEHARKKLGAALNELDNFVAEWPHVYVAGEENLWTVFGLPSEMSQWLTEHEIEYFLHDALFIPVVGFKNEDDLLHFKLRWQ